MTIYWLSFVDPDKPEGKEFLGACLVEADGFLLAVKAAYRKGCNPGGEVAGSTVPTEMVKYINTKWMNRLLTKDECIEFEEEVRHKKEEADAIQA